MSDPARRCTRLARLLRAADAAKQARLALYRRHLAEADAAEAEARRQRDALACAPAQTTAPGMAALARWQAARMAAALRAQARATAARRKAASLAPQLARDTGRAMAAARLHEVASAEARAEADAMEGAQCAPANRKPVQSLASMPASGRHQGTWSSSSRGGGAGSPGTA